MSDVKIIERGENARPDDCLRHRRRVADREEGAFTRTEKVGLGAALAIDGNASSVAHCPIR